MKFSTKATYGLKAMLYLADHYGESSVAVSQIANDEGISAPYLEQILNKLKQEKWVTSVRGPHGGYVLTTKPSSISVGNILQALDENLRTSNSGEEPARERKRPIAHRASTFFWSRLSENFIQTLHEISLQDLITEARTGADSKINRTKMHFSI